MELCWLAGPGSCLPWTILHDWKDQEHYLASPGHTGSPPTTIDWWRMRHILDIGVFHQREGSGDEVANKPSKVICKCQSCMSQAHGELSNLEQCLFKCSPQVVTAYELLFSSVQLLSCVQLCDPMHCSTPGLPVHHQLPESTQTHVHCVGDAIQLSHPLSSPSPPAFSLSQHQGLFQWVSSSHQVAKVLEFQLHQSFQWILRIDLP